MGLAGGVRPVRLRYKKHSHTRSLIGKEPANPLHPIGALVSWAPAGER